MQLVGAVGLELWVESSGEDVDIFAYLEDVDPVGNIRSPLPCILALLIYTASADVHRNC